MGDCIGAQPADGNSNAESGWAHLGGAAAMHGGKYISIVILTAAVVEYLHMATLSASGVVI